MHSIERGNNQSTENILDGVILTRYLKDARKNDNDPVTMSCNTHRNLGQTPFSDLMMETNCEQLLAELIWPRFRSVSRHNCWTHTIFGDISPWILKLIVLWYNIQKEVDWWDIFPSVHHLGDKSISSMKNIWLNAILRVLGTTTVSCCWPIASHNETSLT